MESGEIGTEENINKNLHVPINPSQIHEGATKPTAEELKNVDDKLAIARLEEDIATEEGSQDPDIEKLKIMRTELYNRRDPGGRWR